MSRKRCPPEQIMGMLGGLYRKEPFAVRGIRQAAARRTYGVKKAGFEAVFRTGGLRCVALRPMPTGGS